MVSQVFNEIINKSTSDFVPVDHTYNGLKDVLVFCQMEELLSPPIVFRRTMLYLKVSKRHVMHCFIFMTKNTNVKNTFENKLIGQDAAIDDFVNGLFCHYKGIVMESFLNSIKNCFVYNFYASLYEERSSSVILIMGPSGTGKTATFQLAMDFLQIPFGMGSGADTTKAGHWW